MHRPLFSATVLLVASLAAAVSAVTPAPVTGQMMGDDKQGMREMMQRMMGDVLPPGIDPALLPAPASRGAKLLGHYCFQCHYLPGPGMHTAQEWPAVVARMNRRMQMMSGNGMMGMMMGRIEVPSGRELGELLGYLQTYAQSPINPSRYPDLATPAGRAFQTTCARCHALPDPQQHTAVEWPSVVARMQRNMLAMNRAVPDEQTIGEVIGFLQRHARKQTR